MYLVEAKKKKRREITSILLFSLVEFEVKLLNALLVFPTALVCHIQF